MSGSTIGGIVGGAIGFFVGGPAGAQWGFMIGSFVGAVVDPDRIYGPRLGDVRDQAASDGVPRTYGYGRFPTTGNVIWRDIVKEVEEEQGKGGPEQVTYRYTRSYAIAVCRGPISGFLIIKRNGKIVFDARTDAELTAIGYSSSDISETRAAQAKFMEVATFYYGDQTTPDPTMVAVKGVGNVPNYTDTAFIVCTDDDVTDISGAVPQYEFVVADCGERHEDFKFGDLLLVTGQSKFTGGPRYAVAAATAAPEFEGVPQDTGAEVIGLPAHYEGMAVIAGSQSAGEANYSVNIDTSWVDSDSGPISAQGVVGGHAGWLAYNHIRSLTGIGFWHAAPTPTDWTTYYPDSGVWHISYAAGYYWLSAPNTLRRASFPQGPWTTVASGVGIYDWVDIIEYGGDLYATCKASSGDFSDWMIKRSADGGATWPDTLLTVPSNGHRPYFLCPASDAIFAWCLGGGLWSSVNGWSEWIDIGIDGSGNTTQLWQVDGGRKIVYAGDRLYVIGTGDDLAVVNPETLAVTLVTLPIQNLIGITVVTPPDAYQPIPDSPGYYIDPTTGDIVGPPGIAIDPCEPTLGSIVAEQCISRNVTEIDVSELTDPVTGFRIASVSSPQKNIASLMPAFMFDGSEFDGTLHFPKRGRNATFALTMDDLVEREGDPIQWERTQEPELLRKLTVGYIDPATTYTPTTQQWERRAGTVRAEGESTMELPIVAEKDWAAQVAEKSGKVAWAEADTLKFWLSRQWASLVPAAVGTITDGKGVTHRIRIMRIEDDGGIRMIHAVRDRQDAYTSTATGAQKPLPLFPGSNIRGPTLAAVMNMPAILDSDDRPGLYWAAAGMTDGWAGARLQVLRSGEWVTLGDITQASSVGTLVDELPAHSGDIDTANVMRIRMDETLPSVTFTQLLSERNPVAIVRPDHTVEVVQFQNAAQDSDGVWECTTLIRGNLDTDTSSHDAGATVALLDSGIRFVDMRPDDVGKTLTFRVVSLGTDPDAAPTFDIAFPYIWSSTEWPVAYLDVEKDGDDFILTWIERRRLGTDVDPIRSGNWDGYVVGYAYSGITNEVIVTDPTHTFTLPGATDVDFHVAQLNRLTGRGPETTENVP